MKHITALLISMTLLTSFSSNADEPVWYLGLGVGPNITNADAVGDELRSSVGAALWLSRQWGEMHRLDLSFDYFKFSGSGQDYPSLNLAYGLRFWPESRFQPFALVGAGFGQANRFPRSVDAHQEVFHLFGRLGVENLLKGERWNIGLMADFEHLFMDGNEIDSADLALPMLTFNWRFDSSDEPSPEPAAPASKPRVDTDRDGVYDYKDQCPNTPRGARVNSIGCEPKQKVTKTLKVEFETAKATIRPSFMEEVDEFGKFMQENADIQVSIEGHTDSVGSRAYNIRLSDARAKSVRQALLERWKLDPKRVRAKGYGPDKPIADNDTPDGRQLNRRVNAVLESE